MRILLASLLLVGTMTAQAAVSWQTLGTAGFSSTAAYVSLAYGTGGRPYVAYSDEANGGKAAVMRLTSDGSAWEAVGTPFLSPGRATFTSLAFSQDGTPHVAYVDYSKGYGVTVKRLNALDAKWESVGPVGFSGHADFTSLAFGPDDRPYVAYRDYANSNSKATVMRLNSGGAAWETVGTAGFSTGFVSDLSLALSPSGTPYLAYMDRELNRGTTVMRLKFDSTGWEQVGPAGFAIPFTNHPSLAFAPGGTPYVAYLEEAGKNNKATVMRLNASGTGWETVGAGAASAGKAEYASLAFSPDGRPYVAYKDAANGGRATVMRLNPAGTGWEPVGAAGFSAGAAAYTSLVFAPNGRATLAFRDGAQGNRVTVQQAVVEPSAPTALLATAGPLQATLEWSAPANDGGSAVLDYTATASPGGAMCTAAAPALSCVVTGLTAGKEYIFLVSARSANGVSPASAPTAAVTPFSSASTGVPGMTGTGSVDLMGGGAGCSLASGAGFSAAGTAPPGQYLPYGQLGFNANGCTGSVTITLHYPEPLPQEVQFWKFGPASPDALVDTWFVWTGATLSPNRMTVSYVLTDNGLGDSDRALGSIRDPFAPALPLGAPAAAVTGIPTLSQWGLLWLSLLIGVLFMHHAAGQRNAVQARQR